MSLSSRVHFAGEASTFSSVSKHERLTPLPLLLPQDAEEDEYRFKIEELQGHIYEFPGNIASFLSVMVPSCAPDAHNPVSQRAFTKYRPLRGRRVKSYACLVSPLLVLLLQDRLLTINSSQA